MAGIGNAVLLAVLRSPLHRLVSGSLVLFSYEGMSTGNRYEIPLQYVEKDGGVVVWAGNPATKTWWRNFREPRPATVRLRGRDTPVTVRTVTDPAERAECVRRYRERYPRVALDGRSSFFGGSWKPSPEELDRVVEDVVMVAMEPVGEAAAD